jgi:hypothetical protein
MIAVDDIGAFVALAFEHPGHWHNGAFELAGDELSMTQLAEAFSRASGRQVRYRQVPWGEFEQRAGRSSRIGRVAATQPLLARRGENVSIFSGRLPNLRPIGNRLVQESDPIPTLTNSLRTCGMTGKTPVNG